MNKIAKRIIVVLLTMMLVIAFVACKKTDEQNNSEVLNRELVGSEYYLGDFDKTLSIPEELAKDLAVEKTDAKLTTLAFYSPSIRDKKVTEAGKEVQYGGVLFYVSTWEEALTEEQFNQGGPWNEGAPSRFLATLQDKTLLLYYASDQQTSMETLEYYDSLVLNIKAITVK